MHGDRRDINGRVLEVGLGRVLVEKQYSLLKFHSPRATSHPFFGHLALGGCCGNEPTRFVVCFSFCARSSRLISVSQSILNHAFLKNGEAIIKADGSVESLRILSFFAVFLAASMAQESSFKT